MSTRSSVLHVCQFMININGGIALLRPSLTTNGSFERYKEGDGKSDVL